VKNTDETLLFKRTGIAVYAAPFRLNFKYPFRLAMGVRTYTDLVLLRLEFDGFTSFGEASLPPYLKETQDSVMGFLRSFHWEGLFSEDLGGADETLLQHGSGNCAARASISIAINDLRGQIADKQIWEVLELPDPNGTFTSYTIGISSEAELIQKLADADSYPLIKLKLGDPADADMIRNFRKRSDKTFCADANQGWVDRDRAARVCEDLVEAACQFVEQPFPVGREDDVYWLRQRVALPIIGDESLRNLADFEQYAECFDGMNVKLMKCGGISPALTILKSVRNSGKIPVLGAMAESSCAVSAAAHLASLAHWVDLDGPLLSANDPFSGIIYNAGSFRMGSEMGIGINLRPH